jgi:hypothetical protein
MQISGYEAHNNTIRIRSYTHDEGTYFAIEKTPFRIKSFVNNTLVLTINENDTLYFEKSNLTINCFLEEAKTN